MTFAQKMFSFEGRMGLKDFWICTLILWAIKWTSIVVFVAIMFATMGLSGLAEEGKELSDAETIKLLMSMFIPLSLLVIVQLALVWPDLAIKVKRFHDRGQSGWLSALFFLVIISFPFLSFVPPLLLWLHKKDQSEEVNERGKKILNFQITCSIIAAVWILFQIVGFIIPKVFHWNSLFSLHLGPGEILLLSLIIPIAFNVILVIINTILILTNKEMKFLPVYRFLK